MVIQKDPKAVWLGSGSVLKTASGEYVPIYYYYYLELCLILTYLYSIAYPDGIILIHIAIC